MAKKAISTLNCNFPVEAWNYDDSLTQVRDLQMDYENLDSASVEGIGYVVAAGEEPSSCCGGVVVVGTCFVVVGTSFVVAVVVETLVPFAHWVEVLCCWTLQMDLAGYNDQMGFV